MFFVGFGGSDVVPEKKMSFVGKTPWSSTPTHLYSILVERGLSFDDAKEILNEFDDKSSGFYLSNQVCVNRLRPIPPRLPYNDAIVISCSFCPEYKIGGQMGRFPRNKLARPVSSSHQSVMST